MKHTMTAPQKWTTLQSHDRVHKPETERPGVTPVTDTSLVQASNGFWTLCFSPYPSPGRKEPLSPAAELRAWAQDAKRQDERPPELATEGMSLSWCGSGKRPGHLRDADIEELVLTYLNLQKEGRVPRLLQLWGHHSPSLGDTGALVRLVSEGAWGDRPELHLSNCNYGSVGLQGLLRTCVLTFTHFRARVEGNPMLDLWLTMGACDGTLLPATSWFTDRHQFWLQRGPLGPRVFVGSEKPTFERDWCCGRDRTSLDKERALRRMQTLVQNVMRRAGPPGLV